MRFPHGLLQKNTFYNLVFHKERNFKQDNVIPIFCYVLDQYFNLFSLPDQTISLESYKFQTSWGGGNPQDFPPPKKVNVLVILRQM